MVGRLRLSEWAGRDGERRSRIQVVADAVQFLGHGAVDDVGEAVPAGPLPHGCGGFPQR